MELAEEADFGDRGVYTREAAGRENTQTVQSLEGQNAIN